MKKKEMRLGKVIHRGHPSFHTEAGVYYFVSLMFINVCLQDDDSLLSCSIAGKKQQTQTDSVYTFCTCAFCLEEFCAPEVQARTRKSASEHLKL